jgi:integrase
MSRVNKAYYTGVRKGEILGIRWSQINMDEWMIALRPTTQKAA